MYDKNTVSYQYTQNTKTLTGSLISFRHDAGKKLPLAAGKTPISCSSGLNYRKEKKF